MKYWLIKSDPDDYSAQDLKRDGQTVWSGVANPTALIHIRAMSMGDHVLVYHTGKDKAIVALAEIVSPPRPDPGDKTGKSAVVDIRFDRQLNKPVELAAIKADPAFVDFDLVRISRLSVMPVSRPHWTRIMKMAATR